MGWGNVAGLRGWLGFGSNDLLGAIEEFLTTKF